MSKRRLTEEEKGRIKARIADELATRDYICFAYLFGSFVADQGFRDIDIGIFVEGGALDSFLELEIGIEAELESALRIPLDVRVLNKAPLSFVYNVLKQKIVIIDKDSTMRADFESLIFRKYFDFRHLRGEYLSEIANAPL